MATQLLFPVEGPNNEAEEIFGMKSRCVNKCL